MGLTNTRTGPVVPEPDRLIPERGLQERLMPERKCFARTEVFFLKQGQFSKTRSHVWPKFPKLKAGTKQTV